MGGGFGPMAAGVILLWVRGRSVGAWLRSIFRVRLRSAVYLFALAVPLGALVVAGGAHVVLFGGERAVDALPAAYEYPLLLAFIFVIGGGQEEPGWRGYLLPVLESRYSGLAAAVVVGAVWAVWHLSLFLVPDTVQANISFPLAVQVTGTSIVLTWLTNHARGSVVPAMLLHAGANTIVNFYPVGGVVGATSLTGYGLLTAVVLVVAALVVARDGVALGVEEHEGLDRSHASENGRRSTV